MLSWLGHLDEYVLSNCKQVFVFKDSVSKGKDFADDPLLSIAFYTYLPYQSKTQTQWTINGCLLRKMRQMNYSNTNKNFLINILLEYLMIKNLFVILCLVMTKTHNGNLPTNSMICPTLHWFHVMLGHSFT